MNTLNNDIKAVLDSNKTKAEKNAMLLKLGLRKADLNWVWFNYEMNARYPVFKAGDLTFGVEIECFNVNKTTLQAEMAARGLNAYETGYSHADSTTRYKLAYDGSISGGNGCECVTPILKGTDGENSLKLACEALHVVNARVNRSCGLHVHFGAADMSDEHYVRIFKNYQRIERLIDSFMPASRRASNNHYCDTITNHNFSCCTTKADVRTQMNNDRYHKVNPMSYGSHRTIEFRQHSGTTDYTKIIMWVEFLRALIDYSLKNEIARNITSVDDLPFGNAELKSYLKNRISQFAGE